MRLRKKCRFSLDNVADVASLYDDVMTILNESHTNDKSSDEFVSEVTVYLSDRPNIHREMQPDLPLEEFIHHFCAMHLKAVNMHNVLTGKEKRSSVIDSIKDELEDFKKHINRNDDDYEFVVKTENRVGENLYYYDYGNKQSPDAIVDKQEPETKRYNNISLRSSGN